MKIDSKDLLDLVADLIGESSDQLSAKIDDARESATTEAVRRLKSDKGFLAALKGEDGLGVKAVEVEPDNSAFHLLFEDGTDVKINLPKGDPGLDGTDGKDADPAAVAEELKSSPDFIGMVRGTDGARGIGIKAVEVEADRSAFHLLLDDGNKVKIELPEGKPGIDGKDADNDAIAEALKSDPEFRAKVKGPAGPAGLGVKAVEVEPDNSAFHLIFEDDTDVKVELPEGKAGKDADPEVVANSVAITLKSDPAFLAMIQGKAGVGIDDVLIVDDRFIICCSDDSSYSFPLPKPRHGKDGKDAEPEAVAKLLLVDDDFINKTKGKTGEQGPVGKEGPAGPPGLNGVPGQPGEPGAGIITKQFLEGEVYRKDDIVQCYIGQFYQAKQDTYEIPGDSNHWDRLGTIGFRFIGSKPKDESALKNGDLFIDGGSLFLHFDGETKMVVKRPKDADNLAISKHLGKNKPFISLLSKECIQEKAFYKNLAEHWNETTLKKYTTENEFFIECVAGELTKQTHFYEEFSRQFPDLISSVDVKEYSIYLTLFNDQLVEIDLKAFAFQLAGEIVNSIKQLRDDPPDDLAIPVKWFRGYWDQDIRYNVGDVVRVDKSTYIAARPPIVGQMGEPEWVAFSGGAKGGATKQQQSDALSPYSHLVLDLGSPLLRNTPQPKLDTHSLELLEEVYDSSILRHHAGFHVTDYNEAEFNFVVACEAQDNFLLQMLDANGATLPGSDMVASMVVWYDQTKTLVTTRSDGGNFQPGISFIPFFPILGNLKLFKLGRAAGFSQKVMFTLQGECWFQSKQRPLRLVYEAIVVNGQIDLFEITTTTGSDITLSGWLRGWRYPT